MKKRTLNKELTILMMIASACTLLSACVAVLYVFFSFFIQNTSEDIEYVLKNTSQEFQAHVQFIEDGAVSIRHNQMLDEFFENAESLDLTNEILKPQLSYSMDLYSDRNMIQKQMPFVTSVYLFNNENECVYEHYYAETLEMEKKQESIYQMLQSRFRKNNHPYECVTDEENINMIFRIYDDSMVEKGVCIAVISRDAVQTILNETASYSDCTWMVIFGDERVIASRGSWSNIEELVTKKRVYNGTISLSDKKVIACSDVSGFQLRTMIAVGRKNIFTGLKPTIFMFGIGLGIVVILTICVSFLASNRFSKQVSRMIESIRAFDGDHLDVRMEDSSIQEFHDIGFVFNEMADRIEHLINQVYEKQLLAAQAQTKYLQAQINPHFQFNILAMLSLKAKMAGNDEVYEGLHAFSKLTQGKIFREKEIKIKVSEELEIVQFYLYLQKSRYQEKLSYEILVDDKMINEDLIPRLLIEPLVENAISHGLEPKRENGTVTVHLYEIGEEQPMLHICVEDNGIGFDLKQMEQMEDQQGCTEKTKSGTQDPLRKAIEHTHTGLENTKRMLKILYGEKHKLNVESEVGKGTKIEIVLPVERGERYVESNGSR